MCIRDRLQLVSEVEALEQRIEDEAALAIDANKELIISRIEENIATRQHYQKGKFFQKLKNDTEISTAVDILNDPAKYKSILKG